MKTLVLRLAMAAVLSVSLAASVLAGETKKTLHLTQDVSVNGTVVKKGKYTLVLSANNEAVIMDGSKAVAHSAYRIETGEKKAYKTELGLKSSEAGFLLERVKFDGERESIVFSGSENAKPQN